MTPEEKSSLARFLDLAGDYLMDGHAKNRPNCFFEDDAPEEFSSLPLAYQVDEEEFSEYTQNPTPQRLASVLSSTGSFQNMADIAAAICACKACPLGATRTLAVPGEGVERPLVMVIGEGPGANEDASGRPFVGRAGQLLDKMLASIGLSREKNCYIANMVKCRPPGNRDPEPEEITACSPFLEQQITLLSPRLILCVGRVAAQNLLKTNNGINSLRGTFAEFRANSATENKPDNPAITNIEATEQTAIPVLCTFHPSALLMDESLKRPAWEDLKLLRAKIESLGEG